MDTKKFSLIIIEFDLILSLANTLKPTWHLNFLRNYE